MNVTLQLRYCTAPQRLAAAWLIPGAGAADWLAEMTAWGVPLAGAQLLVLPGAGVLAILQQSDAPQRVSAAQAYGRVTARVYLPVEAAIDPPLTDGELADLLPPGKAQFVWHPRLGLLQFEPAAVLRAADLLAPPRPSERPWNAAQPGTAFNQRLLSIEPAQRPTLQDLIEAARGDIGTQPLQGGKLPSHPGEPAGGAIGRAMAQAGLAATAAAAGAVGAAAAAMAAGMQGLAGMFGAGGGAPAAQSQREARGSHSPAESWLTRLARWAKEQQQAAASNLDQLRNRQVERLLHMLQNSPDQGLRYAIPFGGDAQHRGLARPGASLTERNVDFSLGRIGGGGAADFWNLPEGYRRKLAEQYRALANREIALGRHRRAAYIFAELLGDLTTAAATLATGGHHREAAVLYEQRLNQPLAAAKCLQQGGLWAEAIAIFERLKQWETVGELYGQLDQPDAAERAYRSAVTARLAANDHLGAATLLEQKLHAPLEAQTTLWSGWSWGGGTQDRRCLEASFDLLARHQWHDEARRQVGQLRPTHLTSERVSSAATVLARTARQYPVPDIGQLAAEATRGLIAERLPRAATAETKDLLAALAALVPADRLLALDCDRYQSQRAAADNERQRPAVGSRSRPALQVVRSFRLPPGEWYAAASSGDQFFAAGWLDNRLMIARGCWDGRTQFFAANHEPAPWRPILLAADPRGLNDMYVHSQVGVPNSAREFPATDQLPQPLLVSPHPGCDAETRVLSYGPGGTVLVGRFVQEQADELSLLLTPYEGQRLLPGVQAVRLSLNDAPDLDYVAQEPLPFFARAADYYLGIGRLLVHKRLRQTSCLAPSPILSITGSAPHAKPRIVLGCKQGGLVLWGDTADAPQTTFAADLAAPSVGLNRGGWLIAATADTVEVFSTANSQLNFVCSTDGPKSDPIAVLSTNENQRFAIVTEEGNVMLYEIPVGSLLRQKIV